MESLSPTNFVTNLGQVQIVNSPRKCCSKRMMAIITIITIIALGLAAMLWFTMELDGTESTTEYYSNTTDTTEGFEMRKPKDQMSESVIVLLIDKSGSMDGLKADVITSLNDFIERQQSVTSDRARLYLVQFNAEISVIHNGTDMKDVVPLTPDMYEPEGQTALYDGIAKTINIVEKDVNDKERVYFVIITDGLENGSTETSEEELRELIGIKKFNYGWLFSYIGPTSDQWAQEFRFNKYLVIEIHRQVFKDQINSFSEIIQSHREY